MLIFEQTSLIISHICLVLGGLLLVFNVTKSSSTKILHIHQYLAYYLLTFTLTGYIYHIFTYLYMGFLPSLSQFIIINMMLSLLLFIALYLSLRHIQYPTIHKNRNFLGQIATIYSEKAKVGEPAIAYLRDELGNEHFIEVEAESGEILKYTPVLLIYLENTRYTVRDIQSLVE